MKHIGHITEKLQLSHAFLNIELSNLSILYFFLNIYNNYQILI